MTNWKQDLAISVVMLGLALACGFTAKGYPADANTFPLLLSVLLGILAVILGLSACMRMPGSGAVSFIELQAYRSVFLQVVLITAFILIVPVVGYPAASFLLCFFTACNAGYKKKKVVLLFSLGTSVFVVVVFKLILQVPLPMGMLFG